MSLLPPDSPRLYTPVTTEGGVYSEKVADHSPGIDAISTEASSFTLQVDVPYSQRSAAVSRFLGYQYVDGSTLKRVLPIAHPFWEFSRCRRITQAQGIQIAGDGPKTPVDLGPAYPRPHFARYKTYRLNLQFETPPFAYKTDAEVTEEYQRYCYIRQEPGYQSLAIDGAMFNFDAGFLAEIGDGRNPAFTSGLNIPLSVAQVLCTWYDVPLEFVKYQERYSNIQFCIGKLNATTFLGYAPSTLLMDTPTIELRPNPCPTYISTNVSMLANITFRWHYFEPLPLGQGVSTNLGHNMAFYRGDKKWYPASLINSTTKVADGVTRLYQKVDFKYLFRKPTATLPPIVP
jgi:hypothetical protein